MLILVLIVMLLFFVECDGHLDGNAGAGAI